MIIPLCECNEDMCEICEKPDNRDCNENDCLNAIIKGFDSEVNYDWPSNGGFEGKPEEITPQVGDRFDRVGAENGRYVAPIEGDTPQPVENYHFTEDNITDEPSYHSYEVDRDFGQLQDAINEYNNPALTAEENEFMRGEFQKEYDRNNWPAETFDSGGGTQLELPMSVESLKELGMIHEV